jgi:hypothetical protein
MGGTKSWLRSAVHRGTIVFSNENTRLREQKHRGPRTIAAIAAEPNVKEVAMCFEFEYLYWAKLEEEARQRKEEDEARKQAAQGTAPKQPQPQQHEPVPV